VHAAMMARAEREKAVFAEFREAHPEVEVAVVAAQPVDVHDIDGLREIGMLLAGRASNEVSSRPARDPSA